MELEMFERELKILNAEGYYPTAITTLFCELTFIFETAEEARTAFEKFEADNSRKREKKVIGWWYGKEQFLESKEQFEKDLGYPIQIHYL